MLLDESRLLDTVNREYRLSLTYPISSTNKNEHVEVEATDASYEFINIFPDFSNQNEINNVKRDGFLSTTVLKDEKSEFSVRDVIDVCANSKGGVHFGKPKEGTQEDISNLDKIFSPHLIDASLVVLSDIAWSFLYGTRPVVEKIIDKYK